MLQHVTHFGHQGRCPHRLPAGASAAGTGFGGANSTVQCCSALRCITIRASSSPRSPDTAAETSVLVAGERQAWLDHTYIAHAISTKLSEAVLFISEWHRLIYRFMGDVSFAVEMT